MPGAEWWRSAVIYQIYPRSFADSTGSGMGDLPGISARLHAVAELGADAVWLSPFQKSPQRDAGYDVADYCDVDPIFGTLDDFDSLLNEAHGLGLRLIVDLVPNHTSSDHPWFQEALAAAPGSPERDRYIFRDGKGEHGELPPNNWESVFGGDAWQRVTGPDGEPGQWYLHLFDVSQPDLNWQNPWVREQFRAILRFWLDRGVDGFRVDVAHGLIKAEGLPDYRPPTAGGSMGGGASHGDSAAHADPAAVADPGADAHGDATVDAEPTAEAGTDPHTALQPEIGVAPASSPPYWGQEGVHEIYRDWHEVLASYPGDRMLCAEAWVDPLTKLAKWVRPDEMNQAFNFVYLETPWAPTELHDVIQNSLSAFGEVGAPSTWVLSNHDVVRHATRLGLRGDNPQGHGLGPTSAIGLDPVLGLRRARAATTVMLALPGSAYIYQGEELGLPEVIDLPDSARQDPTFARTHGERYGRDGCRVPIPWAGESASYEFGPDSASWLPQPDAWAQLSRAAQASAPEAAEAANGQEPTLTLYRQLLAHRRTASLGSGTLEWLEDAPPEVIAFRNGGVTVIANLGDASVDLGGVTPLIASGPLDDGALPSDTAVWLAS